MHLFHFSGILAIALALWLLPAAAFAAKGIDRQALVTRHNVVLTQLDLERPLQVGNGEFAFGMDATGLQTFAPFNTMSQWGWNSSPLPAGEKLSDFQGQVVETHGRPVWYPLEDPKHPEISAWMVGNPHRINLGRVGMILTKKDGTAAEAGDLQNVRQELDLWHGIVTSRFELEGVPVRVATACHPSVDEVAVRIESPLIKAGRLEVFLACPGSDPIGFANFVGDWSRPGVFERQPSKEANRMDLVRRLDADVYHVSLAWQGDAKVKALPTQIPTLQIVKAEYGANDKWLDVTKAAAEKVRDGRLSMTADNSFGDPIHGVAKSLRVTYLLGGNEGHAEAPENKDVLIDAAPERQRVTLEPGTAGDTLSFVCAFAPGELPASLPDAEATFAANRKRWPTYWKSGGAVDFSHCTDPRAPELERRVVLSQYLMKVNEAGSLPPQESGLVNNGWFGRFHLEMVWWHAAHWALWNRLQELDRLESFYSRLLPQAKALAKKQGYLGARWPKCIGPNGREWPYVIHAYLGWQQPHPIFFAELAYRANPTRKTLEKWWQIVEATADFLSTYAFFDEKTKRYVLGPPLFVVSENTDPMVTQNPSFELGYWRFGLRTAQAWLERLGRPRNPEWEKVLQGLAPLPQEDGVYVLYEGVQDMWTKFNFEHPALIGTLGMLPGDGVDLPTMRRTLAKVGATWQFDRTWGWDYPMLAMCAARTGDPSRAVDYLLTSSAGFQFDERGLATGGPFPYFPSNGGLLYAVAMMAAGWDGAPKGNAPGFPRGGKWDVRWEGLAQAP
jgi:hypothetical protein